MGDGFVVCGGCLLLNISLYVLGTYGRSGSISLRNDLSKVRTSSVCLCRISGRRCNDIGLVGSVTIASNEFTCPASSVRTNLCYFSLRGVRHKRCLRRCTGLFLRPGSVRLALNGSGCSRLDLRTAKSTLRRRCRTLRRTGCVTNGHVILSSLSRVFCRTHRGKSHRRVRHVQRISDPCCRDTSRRAHGLVGKRVTGGGNSCFNLCLCCACHFRGRAFGAIRRVSRTHGFVNDFSRTSERDNVCMGVRRNLSGFTEYTANDITPTVAKVSLGKGSIDLGSFGNGCILISF